MSMTNLIEFKKEDCMDQIDMIMENDDETQN